MDESIAIRTEMFEIGGNNHVCAFVCVSENQIYKYTF